MYQGKFLKDRNSVDIAVRPSKSRDTGLRSLIFYTVFFLFVFVFYTATYFGLRELRDWLVHYELAQPDQKSQQVFQALFLDANWGQIYDSAGIQDAGYESREVFIRYMEESVIGNSLSYIETSAGLSGGKKYIVRLGENPIATFTLKDCNASEDPQSLPDWQLENVSLLLDRGRKARVITALNHTAYVNGIPLEDRHTIQTSRAVAAEYLPSGINAPAFAVQELTGLIAVPEVKVLDEEGREVTVIYDEETDTFMEQQEVPEISEEEQDLALQALKTYACYMMNRAGSSDLAKYYKKPSDAYSSITSTDLGYVQDAASYAFSNETVTDYCRYSETLFSVRVSLTLSQYRSDGSVKESEIEQSMFFEKQASGKWLCYAMTAIDVSRQVVSVRITFQNGEQILSAAFYENTADRITCPAVAVPEGKAFSGWALEELDSSGRTVFNIVFQPDETGIAYLPAGSTLSAMTVYPLFEEQDP